MNTIWSISKSSRYVDHSHNVLAFLAVAAALQIMLSFQASQLLMPAPSAAPVPVLGTELTTNAPTNTVQAHAPASVCLARPAARS
jgi:hypothetical protein